MAKKPQSYEYRVWAAMWGRCRNPNHTAYKYYGGRGIRVCDEWLEFSTFLHAMGHAPEGTTLDRKENDKGYFKDNCRWATRSEQQRNRRPYKGKRAKTFSPMAVLWENHLTAMLNKSAKADAT